jgi:hypothetical protein
MSSDFEPERAEHEAEPEAQPRKPTSPATYAIVSLLVGAVVGFGLAWTLGGNPFSDVNEVVYRELVIEQVNIEEGRICWAVDPGRRDSPLECAILALDPALGAPEEGQEVLVGLVEVHTPDGQEFRQVVHVGQPGAAPADD